MHFSGIVQGVFFRRTLATYALKHQIKGKAINLVSGDVEVIAQGTKENLQEFMKAIQNDPGHATIETMDIQPQACIITFRTFRTY